VNRKSGVGDSNYVVFRDPLITGDAIRRMRSANFTIKMAYAVCRLLLPFTGHDQLTVTKFNG